MQEEEDEGNEKEEAAVEGGAADGVDSVREDVLGGFEAYFESQCARARLAPSRIARNPAVRAVSRRSSTRRKARTHRCLAWLWQEERQHHKSDVQALQLNKHSPSPVSDQIRGTNLEGDK